MASLVWGFFTQCCNINLVGSVLGLHVLVLKCCAVLWDRRLQLLYLYRSHIPPLPPEMRNVDNPGLCTWTGKSVRIAWCLWRWNAQWPKSCHIPRYVVQTWGMVCNRDLNENHVNNNYQYLPNLLKPFLSAKSTRPLHGKEHSSLFFCQKQVKRFSIHAFESLKWPKTPH